MTAIAINPSQDYIAHEATSNDKLPPPTSNKVLTIAGGSFRLFSSIITITGGIRGLAAKNETRSESHLIGRVKSAWLVFFEKVKDAILVTYYHTIHGALYLASGLCAAVASLHDLKVFDLGPAVGIINKVELGTFLAASLMGLYSNVKDYQNAKVLPANPTADQIEASKRKKTSAILGIISCVSYILNVALLFMGQLAAVAFVIGILGTLTGFIKMLYDYYRPSTPPNIT